MLVASRAEPVRVLSEHETEQQAVLAEAQAEHERVRTEHEREQQRRLAAVQEEQQRVDAQRREVAAEQERGRVGSGGGLTLT